MKKVLRYLLFEEENKRLYKTYENLLESKGDRSKAAADKAAVTSANRMGQATQNILGSLTATGEEMFYVFAIPALGVPIREENMEFHNLMFGSSLTNQGEESERRNVHTALVNVPWLTFKNDKEFEAFKKKNISHISAGETGEGSTIPGLQSLYSVQKSRRSTSSEDKDTDAKESELENVKPVDYQIIKMGSARLAKLLMTRLGNVNKAIEKINKIKDEEKKAQVVSKLEDNGLGAITKQKLRQLSNIDIPISGESRITVSINPISGLPNKPLDDGFKPADYRIFEEIQMMLFVLQTDEVIESEEQLASNNVGEEGDPVGGESVFYFHKKTLAENLDLLENVGSNIASTKTAYISPSIMSGTKNAKDTNKKSNYDRKKDKIIKALTSQNLVSIDSNLVSIWGNTLKKNPTYQLNDTLKLNRLKKANIKARKILGDKNYNIEDDDTLKFIFNNDSKIIDYKKLTKDARLEMRNAYLTIISSIENEDGKSIRGHARDYLRHITGSDDRYTDKKDKEKTEEQKPGKLLSLLNPRGWAGGAIALKLATSPNAIDLINKNMYNWNESYEAFKTGSIPDLVDVSSPIWSCDPFYGVLGVLGAAYVFKHMKIEKHALAAIGRTDMFQTFFTGKAIRDFSKTVFEISAKAKDIKEVPSLYKSKMSALMGLFEGTEDKMHTIDFNSVETIIEKNNVLYHKEAIFTRKGKTGEEDTVGRGRKKHNEKNVQTLKAKTVVVLSDLMEKLFDVKIEGASLTKDKKDLNKEITTIKVLDKAIKDKTEEAIDRIPFSDGFYSINTELHFNAYLYSLAKKSSLLNGFKSYLMSCKSLDSKNQNILSLILKLESDTNIGVDYLDNLAASIKNQSDASQTPYVKNFQSNYNIGKIYLLNEFFKKHPDNDKTTKFFTDLISLSIKTIELESPQSSSDKITGVICDGNVLDEIIGNSIKIINEFTIESYDMLDFEKPQSGSTSSTTNSLNKGIFNKISSASYNCLSNTLFLLLSEKNRIIAKDITVNKNSGQNGVRFEDYNEKNIKKLRKKARSGDESIVFLDAERNQEVYMIKAFQHVYEAFEKSFTDIADDFLNNINFKNPKEPKKPIRPIKPERSKVMSSSSDDFEKKAATAAKLFKQKMKAYNKALERFERQDEKYPEKLEIYERKKADYVNYLSNKKLFLERVEFDIKLFVLLVVANSTPGSFREKITYITNIFRNDITRSSKVKALKLAASNKSLVPGIEPIISDNYIYNTKLKFLID